jgi:hypothetical protein
LSYLEINVLAGQVVECPILRIVDLGVNVLEEPLNMASGMFRASAIEAVGQKQDHAALSEPLGLRAHQVLVDHKLGRVVEVTELGLPEAQVLRVF